MTRSKKPEIGKHYDREEVFEMFGGNRQSALPFQNGKAVCGCYDPQMNPDAPKAILVGVGRYKEQYSRQVAEQNITLPIFLKRSSKKYEFMGYFRAIRYSVDRKEIEKKNTSDRNNDTIAGVLYFEEATTV